jgi:hypothetical protein
MPTRIEVYEIVSDSFNLGITPDTSLEYAQATVDVWEAIAPIVRERKYQHDGCDIRVQVDWEPIHLLLAENLKNSLDLISEPTPGMVKKIYIREMSPEEIQVANANREKSISAYVEISGQNELSKYSFFVETYLYDLFLILNLTLPGSAEFHNITIRRSGYPTDNLCLSSYAWWDAYQEKDQWPLLNSIDPRTVVAWYYSIRRGFAQVPETPIERAIFALFHVCQSDGRPEDMIWLFYGFESFFQTRVGENFSALVDRLILILRPNNEQEKQLRKQLREMYEFRSSFVHGGLSVIHPMHREDMDKRIDAQYRRITELSKYGSRLLLACLQRYIQNGWHEVHYRTIAEPISGEF